MPTSSFVDDYPRESRPLSPLLDLPAPRLRAYAPETIIAETFQAMVALGSAANQMEDFCYI